MQIVYISSHAPAVQVAVDRRCNIPARAINRTGRHQACVLSAAEFAANSPAVRLACAAADVIVVHRALNPELLTAVRRWKAHGKALILDLDHTTPGATWASPNGASPYRMTAGAAVPSHLHQFAGSLQFFNGITVSSPRLADEWSCFAEAYYLPSFLELEHYRTIARTARTEIIVGWLGDSAACRALTDSGLAEALRHVCRRRPHVRLLFDAPDCPALEMAALSDRIIRPSGAAGQNRPQILAALDIGCAPAVEEIARVDDLTALVEFMALKIPWIASNVPAYGVLDGYGWLAGNKSEVWEYLLMDMIDHLEIYRTEAARAPYLFALSRNIDDHVESILELYDRIIASAA